MIRPRTGALLLTATALFVICYFVGGRQEIQWHLGVRRMAQAGWDISQADRNPDYHHLYGISFIGGFVFLVAGVVSVVLDLSRRIRKG
jgi:hypothetical protein